MLRKRISPPAAATRSPRPSFVKSTYGPYRPPTLPAPSTQDRQTSSQAVHRLEHALLRASARRQDAELGEHVGRVVEDDLRFHQAVRGDRDPHEHRAAKRTAGRRPAVPGTAVGALHERLEEDVPVGLPVALVAVSKVGDRAKELLVPAADLRLAP